jgi:hypothetical protein
MLWLNCLHKIVGDRCGRSICRLLESLLCGIHALTKRRIIIGEREIFGLAFFYVIMTQGLFASACDYLVRNAEQLW